MSDISDGVAPALPGLSFVKLLGRGGFAEVFLYEQERPRMPVAVKVLRAEGLSDPARERFAAEANAMAELADHPYIVQVFRSDVTDDGRPYMVMKYYPQRNLAVRAKAERIPVPEVLQIGVRIASAVETAHRAGILHRDIKPANILTSQYGEPGLTDFGIATMLGAQGGEEADGMSVPWSPPEILFGRSQGDRASDVYSLGATLWHLLTGRSPFEDPGGDNSTVALMRRIKEQPPPRTGRDDVSGSLERVLAQAMAKDPAERPESALQLARSLQSVEAEERWAITPEVVLSDEPEAEDEAVAEEIHGDTATGTAPGADPPTRLRRPQQVPQVPRRGGPDEEPSTRRRGPAVVEAPRAARSRQMPPSPKESITVRRAGKVERKEPPGPVEEAEDKGRRKWVLGAAAAAAVAVVAAVGVVLSGGSSSRTPSTTIAGPVPTQVVPPSNMPAVTETKLSPTELSYTWTDPGGQAGDTFVVSVSGGPFQSNGSKRSFLLEVPAGAQKCIAVEIVRNGAAGPPGRNC